MAKNASRTTVRLLGMLLLLFIVLMDFLPNTSVAQETNAPNIVHREDVVYGRVHGAGLLADVAYPESQELLPAIISVHGGRWVGGHKKDGSTIKVDQWAGFGFFAMSIDYRLKNTTPAPACYQDLQCAIRFVHAHAKEFRIDTDRIFLIGQSAGGHMVSLAATLGDGTFPRTGGWEKESNDFRAAISVAAAYDLVALDWGALWTPPGVVAEEARAYASPTNHVSKTSKPLLVLHSDNDQSVPITNALTMIEALEKAGSPQGLSEILCQRVGRRDKSWSDGRNLTQRRAEHGCWTSGTSGRVGHSDG